MATMGERIKQLRKERGMTQTQLADLLQVTKGTVSTWETGTRVPGFDTLNTISYIFNRSFDYIMGKSDDDKLSFRLDAPIDEFTLTEVEEDLTEYALKYARLDCFGREAVEAVIRAEYNRCRTTKTLTGPANFSGQIRIRGQNKEKNGNGDADNAPEEKA